MSRDYVSAPVSEQLGIPAIIAGLVTDLEELRAGKISVNDAMARSNLAKQIFNGVRIYLNATTLLSDRAMRISACGAPLRQDETDASPCGAKRSEGMEHDN